MDKYLSILTNFGCHFTCPYCVVKKNGINIPKTTVHSLDGLRKAVRTINPTIISVSGGGDPLFEYVDHIDFYDRLFGFCERYELPLEMHTSYMHSPFPYEKCYRVVYHALRYSDLTHIKRRGTEKVRVVFVVTSDFTEDLINAITDFVRSSSDIDELSFRQMVDENYKPQYYCHEYLKVGHKLSWWYIEQGDYNTYFVDGQLTNSYKSLKGETK